MEMLILLVAVTVTGGLTFRPCAWAIIMVPGIGMRRAGRRVCPLH